MMHFFGLIMSLLLSLFPRKVEQIEITVNAPDVCTPERYKSLILNRISQQVDFIYRGNKLRILLIREQIIPVGMLQLRQRCTCVTALTTITQEVQDSVDVAVGAGRIQLTASMKRGEPTIIVREPYF